ncbi:MAG TPA: hypothetical protein VFC65_04355 [Prolixibacteraceae bacterium]|nr:hypothetical protein [Prolixibacteraceae bacterium]
MTTLEITTQRERSESSLTGRYFSSSPRILLIILLLFAFSSQVNAQSSQTFNTAGTYTFTPPAGVTSVTAECWGGGKGAQQGTIGGGGGGGGSAYSRSIISVIPGDSYPVTVGSGSTTTAAGGDSWFINHTTLLAKGGNTVPDNEPTGATGGAMGIGDVLFSGGNGAPGTGSNSGGGGSSAGTAANGNTATNENGATAPTSGGSGGNGRSDNDEAGDAGSCPGGGGGGAYRTNPGISNGGFGADGQVIISWTCTSYQISGISTPAVCSGNTATTTLTSTESELPVGAYTVTYNLSTPNASTANTATLTVSPAGTGTFQTVSLTNAGNTTITITKLESGSGSQICSNPINSNQTIEVIQMPSITTQPKNVLDCEDRSVNFEVVVSGTVSSYIWQRKRPAESSFSDIPEGETGISYPAAGKIKVSNVGGNSNPDGAQYRTVVTNAICSVTSDEATLFVNEITALSGGTDVTQCSGSNYSYTVTTSYTAKTYQWKKSVTSGIWVDISDDIHYSGTNSNRLTISRGTPDESGEYRVYMTFEATGADCNVNSTGRKRKLTFLPALSVDVTPEMQSICYNTFPAQLTATATGGSGSFSYQWQSSPDNSAWTPISGANSPTYQPPVLILTICYRIVTTDTGSYSCGTATSASVWITVNPLPITSLIYHN